MVKRVMQATAHRYHSTDKSMGAKAGRAEDIGVNQPAVFFQIFNLLFVRRQLIVAAKCPTQVRIKMAAIMAGTKTMTSCWQY
jgi:hypothetical protein